MQGKHLEIYVGSLIDVGSEIRLLRTLADHFEQPSEPALVLANFTAPSAKVSARRQIDLVVVTKTKAVVVEAKGFNSPVRGALNGPWQQQTGAGAWRDVSRNPYEQTLNAKNAVFDAMRELDPSAGYPSGALVFVPDLPSGSTVPAGDFKASIVGVAALLSMLDQQSTGHQDFDKWRSLARHLGLRQVLDVAEATDPAVMARRVALKSYTDAFVGFEAKSQRFFAIQMEKDGAPISSDELLLATNLSSAFLVGPSGCGKSLLQRELALKCISQGDIPIVIPAKYFDGRLRRLLDASIGTFLNEGAATFLRYAAGEGRRIILFVDGCNECPVTHRDALCRALAGLAQKYPITIIVSAQVTADLPKLGELPRYDVLPPDLETKTVIATSVAGAPLGEAAVAELEAMTSGLDAEVYGDTAARLPGSVGSFARFDAYIRNRLGGQSLAITPFDILVEVARAMDERLSMYVSLPEFHRLAAQHSRNTEEVVSRIYASGIIDGRTDRLSFSHELFQRFFMAESLARSAPAVDDVMAALSEPRFHEHRSLLIGAVAERPNIDDIVRRITDRRVLFDCFQGTCGPAPRYSAVALRDNMLGAISQEAMDLSFRLKDLGGPMYCVELEENSAQTWTKQDREVQALIGYTLQNEAALDIMLGIIATADERLAINFSALATEARPRKIALRSDLFRELYVTSTSHRAAGLKIAMSAASDWPRPKIRLTGEAITRRMVTSASSGQLYFLAKLLWASDPIDRNGLARNLTALFSTDFRRLPFHARFELLHATSLCSGTDPEIRQDLKTVLEALLGEDPVWNSSVFDALSFIGAFEGEGDTASIVDQIHALVDGPDGADEREVCAGIFGMQMDHPHSDAYCEAFNGLDPEIKARFLTMAALGSDPNAFSLGYILHNIVEINSPMCEPALRKWATTLPIKSALYDPPGQTSVLLLAHLGLAQLRLPLEESAQIEEPASAKALRACAEVVYWMGRSDLSYADIAAKCERPWQYLNRHELGVGAGALMLIQNALSETMTKMLFGERSEPLWTALVSVYAKEIAELCRHALSRPDIQRFYFHEILQVQWMDETRDWRRFSIETLGNLGTSDDITQLKPFVQDPALAKTALDSIKQLEMRRP